MLTTSIHNQTLAPSCVEQRKSSRMKYVKQLGLQTSCVFSALFLAAALPASADWSDNFDSYPTGSVAGQGGWQGWTGNAAVAGTVSTTFASSGPNSLQLVAGNDTVQPFTGVNSGSWTLSFQQYLPSSSSGSSWTILMNQYPNNLNWSVQVLADLSAGLIGVFDGAGTQQGVTLSLVRDQWVNMRFDINLSANSVTSYYNNTLFGTMPWQSGGINQLQGLDLYPDEGAGTAQVGAIYYDNFQLTAVPEPSSLALLLIGGVAAGFARSRKSAA